MEIARFRRNCRWAMVIGAAVSVIGLAIYAYVDIWGIGLLIAGVIILMLAWSVNGFFTQWDFQHMIDNAHKSHENRKDLSEENKIEKTE